MKLIIDNFFDQFNWKNNQTSNSSSFNIEDFLGIIDLNKRWVYMGSETEPPC